MGIGADVFIRVALDPDRERRLQRNFEGLPAAAALLTSARSLCIPRALIKDEFYGVFFTVESLISGEPLSELPPSVRTDAEPSVLKMMLNVKTSTNSKASIDRKPLWLTGIIKPFGSIIPNLPTSLERDEAMAILDLALKNESHILPVALSHGDFSAISSSTQLATR